MSGCGIRRPAFRPTHPCTTPTPFARWRSTPTGTCWPHPGGHLLATGGYGDSVQLWAQTAPHVRPSSPAQARLRRLRLANAALREQVIAEQQRTERLFLTAAHTPQVDFGATVAVAFQTECAGALRYGDILATANTDHAISLWSSSTGSGVGGRLLGHTDRINAMAFDSKDRDILASVSDDGMLRFWRCQSSQVLIDTRTGHSGPINDLAFKPGDSARLVAVGDDGALLFWYRKTPEPVTEPLIGHRGRSTRSPSRRAWTSWPPEVRTTPSGCGTRPWTHCWTGR